MIGLALSGGGAKGSYEVGVYKALKKCHIKIDAVSGTSIGAFNGAMIASHREKELANFWKQAKIGNILGFDKEYIDKINSKERDWDLIKLSVNNFINILKDKGINPDGMVNTLKEFNVETRLRKSKIKFGLCTYRLDDKKRLNLFLQDIPSGKLNDYIIASCYLPVFQKRKLVDDNYFFDGGIYNNLPINMLLDIGCNKVYAVDLKAVGIKEKPHTNDGIIYITPSHKTSSIITIDKAKINDNMKMGYLDTLRVLNVLDGYNYYFKKQSDAYYDYLVRNMDLEKLENAKKHFRVKSNKELVIKCVEDLLNKNKYSYIKTYKIKKIVKTLKKKYNNCLAYEIICQLKFAL